MKLLRRYSNSADLISFDTGYSCNQKKSDDEVIGSFEIINKQIVQFYFDLNEKKVYEGKLSAFLKIGVNVYDINEIKTHIEIKEDVIHLIAFDLKENKIAELTQTYIAPLDRIGFTEFSDERNFLIYIHNWTKDADSKQRLLILINEKKNS